MWLNSFTGMLFVIGVFVWLLLEGWFIALWKVSLSGFLGESLERLLSGINDEFHCLACE